MSEVDVIIIGAGAAGLAAAKAAAAHQLTYVVLEASHRIGGRAYTEELAPDMPLDLGCHWMHSGDINPFAPIADRLGFHYRRDGAFKPNLHLGNRWGTPTESAEIMALGEANNLAMERSVDRGDDVAVADLADLDDRWAHFQAYWFTLYTSHDMDQMSAKDVMAYTDTDQNWPVREGYGALVAAWAADVPVSLNAAATRIDWGGKAVRVDTAKGTITAKRALITVSTNILSANRIVFDPPLPDWKMTAATQLPLGVHNRIAIRLAYDPFGPNGPANATVALKGDAPPMAIQLRPFGDNYICGVTGGRHGAWLEQAGMQASIDHLTEHLVAAFGSDIRKALTDRTIVTAWGGDPWTLGSYSGARPGQAHQRAVLARPIDDILYFAGEATSPNFFSTCHGAYYSGIAAIELMMQSALSRHRPVSA